jgi:hypothetical protein
VLTSACPLVGMWRKPTAFRQPLQAATTARVVQSRTVRLISGVALDECHRSGALPDARTNF